MKDVLLKGIHLNVHNGKKIRFLAKDMRRGFTQYRRLAKTLKSFGLFNEGTRRCLRFEIERGAYTDVDVDLDLVCCSVVGLPMIRALSANIGNAFYRDLLVKSLVNLERHENQKIERHERDEHESSERQNRLLQQAVRPLALQLQQFQCGIRDVIAHEVDHGSDRAFVVVDEELNKQTIFVSSNQEMVSTEPADVAECDELRKCSFHAGVLATALRLLDAVRVETPIHSSRATILVGHGVGGGIALVLGALLHASTFDVRNVVMLGSPPVVNSIQDRVVSGLNPVRVVTVGDPLPDSPLFSGDGPLRHVGEILLMEPENEALDETPPYSLDHYVKLLECPHTPLSYSEGEFEADESRAPEVRRAEQSNDFVSPV